MLIEFPETGRIAIIGDNESGKSTLLEAITSALFGLNKEDITWGKERAKLELEFSSGEHRYFITRSIGRRQLHSAKLVPIIDGSKDHRHAVENITEIKRQIEQVTGMDESSFAKLVYVKQKDLDALKSLTRGPREELVNRVMGIEVFDQATDRLDDERNQIRNQLKEKRPLWDQLRNLEDEYARKKQEAQKLREEIGLKTLALGESKEILSKSEEQHKNLEWMKEHTHKRDLADSKKKQSETLDKQMKRLEQGRSDLVNVQAQIAKFDPPASALQDAKAALERHELQETTVFAAIGSLEDRKNQLAAQLGLTQISGIDILTAKSSALRIGILSTILALGSVFGLLVYWPITLAAAVFAFTAVVYYRRYSRLERLSRQASALIGLGSQIELERKRYSEITRGRPTVDPSLGVRTAAEAEQALNRLKVQMLQESGHSSVDGLRSAEQNLARELRELKGPSLVQAKADLEGEISGLDESLKKMQENKPDYVDSLEYSDEVFKATTEKLEAAREQFQSVHSELMSKEALHGQLNADLAEKEKRLAGYPALEAEITSLEIRNRLLESVRSEYSETSKELRGKVIPQARMIINQILPTLTSNRYSDFEITEDLRFKVFASESGQHEEREVFSGGTQDQFLIALRLAFTQSILDSRVRADKYCMMLDECVSSSDETRKQGIFEILELMKGTFAQILIIAHEDISNWVDHYLVLRRNSRGYGEIQSISWKQTQARLDAS